MNKEIFFELKSIYRDNLRITGYTFGSGEKSACIIGGLRGNELQQVLIGSQLVRALKNLEEQGRIHEGRSVLVIPAPNSYSMNIEKRFWPTDNTDINRMFPGYDLGETTQRVAAGIFERVKDYRYGIQLASFYLPGRFTPHVRMMHTGYESVSDARKFGLPYVLLRDPRPYDTATLNYNWQVWNTKAFSVFASDTSQLNTRDADIIVKAILNFLANEGIIDYISHKGYISSVIDEKNLLSIKSKHAGLFHCLAEVNSNVSAGQVLAEILDPLDGSVKDTIKAPVDATVFFVQSKSISYSNAVLFKLIPVI